MPDFTFSTLFSSLSALCLRVSVVNLLNIRRRMVQHA